MRLTVDEIAKYAPYHRLREFDEGFDDYTAKRWLNNNYSGVTERAYFLGFECAHRRSHTVPAEV